MDGGGESGRSILVYSSRGDTHTHTLVLVNYFHFVEYDGMI